MKKLKKFLIYIICIAAFWILSDVLIYLSINGMFQRKETKVFTAQPEVIIQTSAATRVNGVVRGTISNNTGNMITKQYIKIDAYSPRNIKLGSRYVTIENLPKESKQNFELWYRLTEVDHLTVSVVDSIEDEQEDSFLSHLTMNDWFIAKLLLIMMIK